MSNKIYNSDNIFARILRGEVPYRIVCENETVLSFHDKYPDAPVHILVVPKGQYISYDDFILRAPKKEVLQFFKTIREIIFMYNLEKTGYRLVTNYGVDGEQVVPHFHIHILGGKRLGKHVQC